MKEAVQTIKPATRRVKREGKSGGRRIKLVANDEMKAETIDALPPAVQVAGKIR